MCILFWSVHITGLFPFLPAFSKNVLSTECVSTWSGQHYAWNYTWFWSRTNPIYHNYNSDLYCYTNLINKYADDVNLFVPEHTDVDIVDEFKHIKNWTIENKMILNMSKTREIVFRRPCPVRFHLSPSFNSIEMVDHVKSFGVMLHAAQT